MGKLKYKFHIPTQSYGFLEVEGTDLEKMEDVYTKYAEVPIAFRKGKFIQYKTFTGEVILYNDITHQYTDIEGTPLLSASQYAKSIKPIFNKEAIIPAIAKKYKVNDAIIDKMWTANGNISLTFGNAIHYAMEQWFKYRDHSCAEKEYNLPKHPFLREVVSSFPDKNKNILPEVIISDVKNKMVGRADALMLINKKKKIIIVRDYKSDNDVQKNLDYHFKQLSFYAQMLEQLGWSIPEIIIDNYTDSWHSYKSKPLKIEL